MNNYNKNVIDKAKLIDADAVIKQNYTLGPLLNVILSNVIKIEKQICITIIISFIIKRFKRYLNPNLFFSFRLVICLKNARKK